MQAPTILPLALIGLMVLGCSGSPRSLDRSMAFSSKGGGALWLTDRRSNEFVGLEISADYQANHDRVARHPFPCSRIRSVDASFVQCEDSAGLLSELRSIDWPDTIDREPSSKVVSEFPVGLGSASVAPDGTWVGESGDEIVFWDGTRIQKPEGSKGSVQTLWLGRSEGLGVLTFDQPDGKARWVWPIRKGENDVQYGKSMELSMNALPPVKDDGASNVVLLVEGRGLHPERLLKLNLQDGSVRFEGWPIDPIKEAREWFQTPTGLWGASYALDRGEVFDLKGICIPVFGEPKDVAVDQKGGRLFVLGRKEQSSVTVINLRRQSAAGESRPRASGVLTLPNGDYGDLSFSASAD